MSDDELVATLERRLVQIESQIAGMTLLLGELLDEEAEIVEGLAEYALREAQHSLE